MWPPFPCALPNIAVPEEEQWLVLVPTAPKRIFYLLFIGWNPIILSSFKLQTWTLLSFIYQPQNIFLKDVYDKLSDPFHRVD